MSNVSRAAREMAQRCYFLPGVVRKRRNRDLWCNFCPNACVSRSCPAAGSLCAQNGAAHAHTRAAAAVHRCRVRTFSAFTGNDASIKSRRVRTSGAPNNGPALQRRPWGSAEGHRLSHAPLGTSALLCDPGMSPLFTGLAVLTKNK